MLTVALVALLPAGGAAFFIDQPVRSASLIASLPLLPAWIAALTVVVAGRATAMVRRGRITG